MKVAGNLGREREGFSVKDEQNRGGITDNQLHREGHKE